MPPHTYFNEILTSEVVDIDQESAISFLNECYNFPCPEKIEKYLVVVEELKREVDG
jgi:hypothetical protein